LSKYSGFLLATPSSPRVLARFAISLPILTLHHFFNKASIAPATSRVLLGPSRLSGPRPMRCMAIHRRRTWRRPAVVSAGESFTSQACGLDRGLRSCRRRVSELPRCSLDATMSLRRGKHEARHMDTWTHGMQSEAESSICVDYHSPGIHVSYMRSAVPQQDPGCE
jgi:hypothetical protein